MNEPEPRSITFDRIADRYDETRGGLARGNDFANCLVEFLPAGALVVEPGVGTGAIALPLRERGFDVVGFDLASEMLSRAHARLGNRVGLADVQDLPVATASIEAVVTVWILHLVAQPERLVAEIARILRPGGVWCAIGADETCDPDDIVPIKVELDRALGRHRDAPDRVRAWSEPHGFAELHRGFTTRWEHRQSPMELVAAIEARTWSSCWDISEADWKVKVEPSLDALRDLPRADEPRDRVAAHSIQVFARP